MSKNEERAAMVRVNHAGEYGAVRIYQGQHFVFNKSDKESAALTAEMARHEQVHLDYFENYIATHHVRPTFLLPLWHVGGFALGVATAALGRKAGLACTQAVEEVIEQHYTNQIEELKQESALKQAVIKFREDERAHHAIAKEENQQDYPLLRAGIGALCRVAIALSSRF
jgi:ubiquinone biosynthesis monooxygenase Coq7